MKRIVTGGLVALLLAALLPATALAADVALSFTGLTPTFGDAPVDITGYATPDGTANALTFASTTPAICTTSGADGEIVTLHKAGSCSITASQSGNDASDSFTVAKADPTCAITGYTVAYNAAPHTASGNCLGVDSGILSGLNKSATTHTDAGTFNNDPWTFADPSGDYNPASGTVDSAITPINPDCAITGYNVTFDNANHTALGDCTGVGAVVLLGLDTSATTHKDAGTYNGDPWSFHDANGNYNNDSGTVDDAISKAAALCSSITGYSVTYNGSLHTASGHCFALDGTTQLAGLDLLGTAHTNAGTYLNDPWTFAGTSNYSNTSYNL